MPERAITRGPTSDTVAANVKRIRRARALTAEGLSDLLAELGRPMLATGITSIETGRRRVDVDDLMALAIALRVSPVTLLMPDTSGVQQVTGAVANGGFLWEWATCAAPLPTWGVSDPVAAVADFQLHAVPAHYQRLAAAVAEAAEQYERWKAAGMPAEGDD